MMFDFVNLVNHANKEKSGPIRCGSSQPCPAGCSGARCEWFAGGATDLLPKGCYCMDSLRRWQNATLQEIILEGR